MLKQAMAICGSGNHPGTCRAWMGAQGAESLRTHTELGAGVFLQAEVPNTSRIYVDIGLGFHAELLLAEALQVAAQRKAVAQVRC